MAKLNFQHHSVSHDTLRNHSNMITGPNRISLTTKAISLKIDCVEREKKDTLKNC